MSFLYRLHCFALHDINQHLIALNAIVLHALYFIELRRFPLCCLAMHCTALHYSVLNWDTFHSPALDYSALLCTVILPRGANQMIATAQYRNKIGPSLHNSWYNTEWPHMTPVCDNTTNFSCWFPYYRPGRHIWGGLMDKYSQPVWTTVFRGWLFLTTLIPCCTNVCDVGATWNQCWASVPS